MHDCRLPGGGDICYCDATCGDSCDYMSVSAETKMSAARKKVAAYLLLHNDQQANEHAYLSLLALLNDGTQKRQHRYWEQLWLRWQRNNNSVMLLYEMLLQVDDTEEFRLTLRMPPGLYHELLAKVTPLIEKKNTRWRKAIPADVRLALTMRYLALGDGIRSLHQQFGVGLSTVGPVIRETCNAIYQVLEEDYFKMPLTAPEWLELESIFRGRWNLPHCNGALDGKHVRIQKPFQSGSLYWNYKKYDSVIMMALVDGNYMFRYVGVGSEGRASDGGVWRRSQMYDLLHDEENPLQFPPPVNNVEGFNGQLPYFFVGDDAFALEEHLMKPYPGHHLSPRQRVFNYRISRARRIVENAFSILAAKFRIFRQAIEMSPDSVSSMVMACCAMHNMCRVRIGDNYIDPSAVDHKDSGHNLIPGLWREEEEAFADLQGGDARNSTRLPKNIRHQLANYFVSFHGQLPWQYRLCHVDRAECDVPPE